LAKKIVFDLLKKKRVEKLNFFRHEKNNMSKKLFFLDKKIEKYE